VILDKRSERREERSDDRILHSTIANRPSRVCFTRALLLVAAALAFYFFTFISSLDGYALGISNLRTAVLEYQTFNEFVNRRSEVKDKEDAVEFGKRENPTIEFASVSFTYGGKTILDNVSFKIEGGGTLGIVGSSGCGKSTIMRLLLR